MKKVSLCLLTLISLKTWADERSGYKMPPCSISSDLNLSAQIYAGATSKAILHLESQGTGTITQANVAGEVSTRYFLWTKDHNGRLNTKIFRVEDKTQHFFGPLANSSASVLKCAHNEMKCMVIEQSTYSILSRVRDEITVSKLTQTFEANYIDGEFVPVEKISTSIEILIRK